MSQPGLTFLYTDSDPGMYTGGGASIFCRIYMHKKHVYTEMYWPKSVCHSTCILNKCAKIHEYLFDLCQMY